MGFDVGEGFTEDDVLGVSDGRDGTLLVGLDDFGFGLLTELVLGSGRGLTGSSFELEDGFRGFLKVSSGGFFDEDCFGIGLGVLSLLDDDDDELAPFSFGIRPFGCILFTTAELPPLELLPPGIFLRCSRFSFSSNSFFSFLVSKRSGSFFCSTTTSTGSYCFFSASFSNCWKSIGGGA